METTNHEYHVSFLVAKQLKEAGFNWECRGYFDGTEFHPNGSVECTNYNSDTCKYLKAPTLDVAQRWLREVKNIQIFVSPVYGPKNWTPLIAKDFWLLHEDISSIAITSENFDTYELALESGIKKALELILEKGE